MLTILLVAVAALAVGAPIAARAEAPRRAPSYWSSGNEFW